MDKGFFGGMFDFNRDGKLDSFERTADFAAFMELTSSTDDETEAEAEKRITVLMGDDVGPRREWIDTHVSFTLEDDYIVSKQEGDE